jgi:hypothetical protein
VLHQSVMFSSAPARCRYDVKCTYHDGGEFCHAKLERRPARAPAATAKPARTSALLVSATGGGSISKTQKKKDKKTAPSSSNKAAKKGRKDAPNTTKVEFVLLLTCESFYRPDGFHAPQEPDITIEGSIPDGPGARKKAIDLLEQKAGEMWDEKRF